MTSRSVVEFDCYFVVCTWPWGMYTHSILDLPLTASALGHVSTYMHDKSRTSGYIIYLSFNLANNKITCALTFDL